jgi:hypothetical protein
VHAFCQESGKEVEFSSFEPRVIEEELGDFAARIEADFNASRKAVGNWLSGPEPHCVGEVADVTIDLADRGVSDPSKSAT